MGSVGTTAFSVSRCSGVRGSMSMNAKIDASRAKDTTRWIQSGMLDYCVLSFIKLEDVQLVPRRPRTNTGASEAPLCSITLEEARSVLCPLPGALARNVSPVRRPRRPDRRSRRGYGPRGFWIFC